MCGSESTRRSGGVQKWTSGDTPREYTRGRELLESMEEPQLVPPRVQQKGMTSTSTPPISEETTQLIEAYLEYNTICNYEARKVMSHLAEQFGIESFRCLQPSPFWTTPSETTWPAQAGPSIARGKE